MNTLRRVALALALIFSLAACGTSITGPLSPDPGQLSPDPGQLSPDPGQLSPDPGQLSPDPGQ
jgi:predicted small lipoprotein YifL